MISLQTSLVRRLQGGDSSAWLELWDVFGPSIERMVRSIARSSFTPETIQDIRQETLLELFGEIGRFDPGRGVKFSTWLHAIARHIVSAELARRGAIRRNRGVKPLSLDPASLELVRDRPDEEFERQVFRAKVYRAIRLVEKQSRFIEFEVYKMKICRPLRSNEIAALVGISEASVSRYVKRIRARLQETLREVVREYSWTEDEAAEIGRNRLDAADDDFDSALGDIYSSVESDRRNSRHPGETGRGVPG